MKKAVILLATLLFVMLLIFLIGVNTKLLKRGFEISNETKFMVQVNSLLKDITVLIDKKAPLITNATFLNVLTSAQWSIEYGQALKVTLDMKSDAKALNINAIRPPFELGDGESHYGIYDIISSILETYEIRDSTYLLDLILDTVDADLDERTFNSEIALVDANFEQGHIHSMQHFRQILSYYARATNDSKASNVPWEKYIAFTHRQADINFLDTKMLAYVLEREESEIAKQIQENQPIEDMSVVFSPEEVNLLTKLGVQSFVPIVKCIVHIETLERVAKAEFLYDLKTKRVSDVVINIQN